MGRTGLLKETRQPVSSTPGVPWGPGVPVQGPWGWGPGGSQSSALGGHLGSLGTNEFVSDEVMMLFYVLRLLSSRSSLVIRNLGYDDPER